ncbi:hypothetical protein JOF56_007691 [Kibdelosporangium banguiense]|uniref:Sulfotransferase family protein n=1 Tax=Kibdelosporangium banguiense TaxID=1365924 RepID=A0ABS4TSC1_9PSEU|nr:hypothetical protein [Kibdelosporangium banguiense]MBP2327306.1 hypothetical protein [Kibdelosporangium banguiense]
MASPILLGDELTKSVRAQFDPVLVVLSPPRSGSTALARAFWPHPAFRWYVHEPYDLFYHQDAGSRTVLDALRGPVEVGRSGANGLVVKEMTFQAGRYAGELAAAATLPVAVALRDPRLAIESRMRQRQRAGRRPSFPHRESGWADLVAILEQLRANETRYVIVDTTRLRAEPEPTLMTLCELLGLPYTADMLTWRDAEDVQLGQLADEQSHWYDRVLRSCGLQPPTEKVPDVEDFPPPMRTHVEECLEVYHDLRDDPEVLP